MVTGVENSPSIPVGFRLHQNYPNPFNPATTIKYSIPGVGTRHPANAGQVTVSVQLKVYDVLGIEVATLVDEYKQPGSYRITFNAQNYKLTSGIYFYSLRVGDSSPDKSGSEFCEVKKMLLLK